MRSWWNIRSAPRSKLLAERLRGGEVLTMPGTYTIEARGEGRVLTSADFHKPNGEDEEPDARGE